MNNYPVSLLEVQNWQRFTEEMAIEEQMRGTWSSDIIHTHTIYLRPAAEPKGLLTLSDTTLLMLHRGLTNPCVFFDSLLYAACYSRQSPYLMSTLLVLHLPSLIRHLWVSIVSGRLA